MTPGLSYYWEGAREYCGDDKWDEEKKQKKNYYQVGSNLASARVITGDLVRAPYTFGAQGKIRDNCYQH